MKNFVQEGKQVTLTSPGTIKGGAGVKVGSIVGINAYDVLAGESMEVAVQDVFDVDKNSAEAWTEGLKIYWDDTAKVFTATSSSNTLAGTAVLAAANPSATGRLRLNGSF